MRRCRSRLGYLQKLAEQAGVCAAFPEHAGIVQQLPEAGCFQKLPEQASFFSFLRNLEKSPISSDTAGEFLANLDGIEQAD